MEQKPEDPKDFDEIIKNYDREAIERLRKAGNRLPGFSLFFAGVFIVSGAVFIFLFQIGFWLKNGHWLTFPLSDLLLKIGISIDKIAQAVEWKGIAKIILWIGDMSSAIVSIFLGALLMLFSPNP
jgi:hypothetical protein